MLSRDVHSPVNVPSFDRSNFDGFAVQAKDTHGVNEESPVELTLLDQSIAAGVVPSQSVTQNTAMAIATGGVLPRGADAIVMIEHTDVDERENGSRLLVRRASTAGFGVSFTGTDVSLGETVLYSGDHLTSRETGVLAAIGLTETFVWRKPRVAILSTGDEIIAPGEPMKPGLVYDSNARIIADAVRELGAEPLEMGVAEDDLDRLQKKVDEALVTADVVLLSGGTSKGQGDLSSQIVARLENPGVVVHGVALKPGKPICLAGSNGKPVVVLPGFPTSAVFTFHEFVAPIIRRMAGNGLAPLATITAELASKVNSEIGRTEYLLVELVEKVEADSDAQATAYTAFPIGKGSGSVTTFSRADGFVAVDRHREIVEAGTTVQVQLLGRDLPIADLVVIGSHCVGLDFLLSRVQQMGFHAKRFSVGSTAGLDAAKSGQCDVAGIHLLDLETNIFNEPFMTKDLTLVKGYTRTQGVAFRKGDERFQGDNAQEVIDRIKNEVDCLMINRNQGSGTRILIDQLLQGDRPQGYAVQTKNHHAVVAAIEQHRADWGVAIEPVVRNQATCADQIDFIPHSAEHFDFAIPQSRAARPAVVAFLQLLQQPEIQLELESMGLKF